MRRTCAHRLAAAGGSSAYARSAALPPLQALVQALHAAAPARAVGLHFSDLHGGAGLPPSPGFAASAVLPLLAPHTPHWQAAAAARLYSSSSDERAGARQWRWRPARSAEAPRRHVAVPPAAGAPGSAAAVAPQSQSPPAAAPTAAGGVDVWQYEGPMNAVVRRVKLLSLSSLALTVVGSPLLIYLSSPAGMSSGAKAGIVLTLCSFGCFTTALLQWFVSPYVLRLRRVAGSDEVEAEVLTILAQPRVNRFRVDEIGEAHTQRPLSTFAARGVVYYLHTDSASEAVLESLGLRRAEHEQPQQGKKKRNDDDEDDD